MNPHDWKTFGDFAGDAFIGFLVFLVCLGLWVWWANRKDGDK